MAENQNKKSNKKLILGIVALVAVVAILATVFFVFREKPVEGAKAITIEVIDNEQNSTVYDVNTDAEFLRQAMEDADGLEFSGDESEEYGLTVMTINGVTADFNTENAYWGFYVNDTYCNYGVSFQPVEDGDAFIIKYETY
ncbi:MAG: DUF4430 domain-containing protein [Lachnospiraceae bacterium]